MVARAGALDAPGRRRGGVIPEGREAACGGTGPARPKKRRTPEEGTMTLDLTAEEMELVLRALKEHAAQRQANGLPRGQADALVARLEVVERQNRGTPLRRASAAPPS